jgi:protein-S-isoprenylcysteine O-methyltransferase Ste14
VLTLLKSLGLALALANLKRRIRSLAIRGALGAVAVVVLVVALCFFLVAAHLWLSQLVNPIASAAIIGGVLLAIALLLFFLASRPMGQRARAVENPVEEVGEALSHGASRLNEALGPEGSPLRNPVFQAAGLALIAGFFLGRRGRGRDKD